MGLAGDVEIILPTLLLAMEGRIGYEAVPGLYRPGMGLVGPLFSCRSGFLPPARPRQTRFAPDRPRRLLDALSDPEGLSFGLQLLLHRQD